MKAPVCRYRFIGDARATIIGGVGSMGGRQRTTLFMESGRKSSEEQEGRGKKRK